ncbi:MAG: SCP2 sterol-binding domain-containing protein [Promethearchaeota archaeon]
MTNEGLNIASIQDILDYFKLVKQMTSVFKDFQEEIEDIDIRIQFKFKDEINPIYFLLEEGKISYGSGSIEKLSITIDSTRIILMGVLIGKIDLTSAYMAGDLNVEGNLHDAMTFQEIVELSIQIIKNEIPQNYFSKNQDEREISEPFKKKVDFKIPNNVIDPTLLTKVRTLKDKGIDDASIQDVLDYFKVVKQVTSVFEDLQEEIEDIDIRMQFNFKDKTNPIYFIVENGKISYGSGSIEKPSITIDSTKIILMGVLIGEIDLTSVYMAGDLNVEGSLHDAMAFDEIIALTIEYIESEIPEKYISTNISEQVAPKLSNEVIDYEIKYADQNDDGTIQEQEKSKEFKIVDVIPSEEKPPKGAIIFVSYATKDADDYQVKEIAERLTENDEIEDVLYWQEDMKDNIIKYMNDNLGKCDLMILFCSENALKSEPVNDEWMAAKALRKPIIPVFNIVEHIPPLLRQFLGVQFDVSSISNTINALYDLVLKKLNKN